MQPNDLQEFGETSGNTYAAEFHIQRSIVDYPEEPLAAIKRSSDGSTVDEPGGPGRIVLD